MKHVHVWGCPHCGKDHRDLEVFARKRRKEKWDWIAICPVSFKTIVVDNKVIHLEVRPT